MPSARHLAITLLHRCHTTPHTLDHWLEKFTPEIEKLNRPDRAFLHALVFGVLRWQRRLDWIIDRLATRPGKKIDPLIRIVLRLGLFQIFFLDRIPPSAAVNTAVEWVKSNNRSWATGFVNGVLRRATKQTDLLHFPPQEQDTPDAIGIQHAFPSWLIKRWLHRLGAEETISLCEAVNTVAPICLRVNTLKTTRKALMAAIQHDALHLHQTLYSPEGLCFVSPQKPIAQWPAYGRGEFQIQDEAAQLVAHLLSPRAGQRVWDACAGRGTKTAHIAQLMGNQGQILATDQRKDKLASLESEMERLSIRIVQTRPLDLSLDLSHAGPPPYLFDRILLDAPCSGLGVLQKNPDGKWRTQPSDLHKCAIRQLEFLEQTVSFLAPDGIIVYAVCSLEPEENVQVIDRFLQKHREFGIHTDRSDVKANIDPLLTAEGFLQTLPNRHQMDGFFAVALKRKPENQL